MRKFILPIILLAAMAMPFLANAQMYGYRMMGGYGSGWGIGGIIIMIIFWVVIIALFIGLIRWAVRGGRHHHHWEDKNSAVDILKERYAKGEIKKEEFEEKMKDLNK